MSILFFSISVICIIGGVLGHIKGLFTSRSTYSALISLFSLCLILGIVFLPGSEDVQTSTGVNPLDFSVEDSSTSAAVSETPFDTEAKSAHVILISSILDDGTNIQVQGYIGTTEYFFYLRPDTAFYDISSKSQFNYSELEVGKSYYIYGIQDLRVNGFVASAVIRADDLSLVEAYDVVSGAVKNNVFTFSTSLGDSLTVKEVMFGSDSVQNLDFVEYPILLIGYSAGEGLGKLDFGCLLTLDY